MTYNNFRSSVYTLDKEIVLERHPKLCPKATWSDYKHHNTVEFYICFFRYSTTTSSKVYTKRTSDKAIILQSWFLDALHRHRKIQIFLMNMLQDEYICPLWKDSAPLLPEGTIKCMHLAPKQIHRGSQLKQTKNGATAELRVLVEKVILWDI